MRCATPDCPAEALYFRSGSLHWVDEPAAIRSEQQHRMQLIWLCAECSRNYVVQTWRPVGQQVRRRCGELVFMQPSSVTRPIEAAAQIPVSESAEAC